LALAFFLPVHFYVLSLALTDPAALDGFLHWAEHPLVKLAEFGLVFLLAVHLFGGLRLLALELLPWSGRQKLFVAVAVAGAFGFATLFLLNAI
jgi:fumarate reductase subunit D